ncbi:hypothetical protein ACFXKW_00490 [Streptomyces sp. NPDC059193]|uniref:hypothetical protein n=1 Tax=Streptomyces sp. NPDC059193 TaxID=3346763 RepID=UPI0036982AA6
MKLKLKRMAIVAAAAVVGPTVLMSTPAMADEVQAPAVTTPDAEPKDEVAPESGEATAPSAPRTDTPNPETGQVTTPEAGRQAQDPKAKPETKDKAAAQGPAMTLTGLPAEFKAGSDWREFSLHVDNSGREAADDYSLELVLWTLDTFGWESSDIKAEVYAPDASGSWTWQKIEAYGSEEVYSLGVADVDIEKNEVFDLKIRMQFAQDTPLSRFSLSTTAEGGTADRVRYESKVTAAEEQTSNQGPKVALKGLPEAGFKAGGNWQPFTLNVDNSGRDKLDRYGFAVLFHNDAQTLKAKHLDVEMWDGERWVTTAKDPSGRIAGTIFDRAVGKDARFDVQLRAKFTPDAPVGDAFIVVNADDYKQIKSNQFYASTSITAPSTTDTGNQPKPDGGATPISDQGGTTGGELAATGSDPATTWALGGAGVALAMGAALVAGTGKRRRPTA